MTDDTSSGLGEAGRGSSPGTGPHSGQISGYGRGSDADVGRRGESPGAASSSPGDDPGTGLGDDRGIDPHQPPDDPNRGIADRVAKEKEVREEQEEAPQDVPDEREGTTPGYTP